MPFKKINNQIHGQGIGFGDFLREGLKPFCCCPLKAYRIKFVHINFRLYWVIFFQCLQELLNELTQFRQLRLK